MEIIKKNIVSLIFGLIAIAAVAAAFYPMNGKFDDLSKQLEARKAKYQQAKQILEKPRELPVVKLDENAERTPLTIFPMPVITKMAQGYMEKLVSQSRGVFEAAVQINRDECSLDAKGALLLVGGSLPEPTGNTELQFRTALLPENPDAIYSYLRTKVLGGGYPPSSDDITKAENALKAEYESQVKRGLDGNAINQEQVMAAFEAARVLLPEKLKKEAAAKSRMYVDPEAIAAPKEITGVQTSPPAWMIWYAQAALWVQADVCRAIAETNHAENPSVRVTDAPVKRLVSINIPFGPMMYTRSTIIPGSETPMPVAAPVPMERGGGRNSYNPIPFQAPLAATPDAGTGANSPPQRQYLVSSTGRTCNSIYDVIGFTVVVHVDQTQLPLLLKQLSTKRFITVKKMDLLRKDNNELLAAGFVYGPAPVAEVTLDCEALQMREWTTPLMPRFIKDQLLGVGVEYISQLKGPEKMPQ